MYNEYYVQVMHRMQIEDATRRQREVEQFQALRGDCPKRARRFHLRVPGFRLPFRLFERPTSAADPLTSDTLADPCVQRV